MHRRQHKPKFQVFVSSTYTDLREEREAVAWEILRAGHIPAGMEQFPATDDRGWKIIQRTIDESDYYVLLIGGRYGSVDAVTGISWTQREYEYARKRGVHVLAYVKDSNRITRANSDVGETAAKLEAFIRTVRDTHNAPVWTDAGDLRAKVAHALRQAIEDDELDGTLPPGWYRGDAVPSVDVTEELARLSAENSRLRERVAQIEAGKAVLRLTADEDGEPRELRRDSPIEGHRGSFEMYELPRLRLKNVGSRVARNVVGRVWLEGALLGQYFGDGASWFDASQRMFISSFEGGNGSLKSIELTIRAIGVNQSVPMPRLYVRQWEPETPTVLACRFVTEDGDESVERIPVAMG